LARNHNTKKVRSISACPTHAWFLPKGPVPSTSAMSGGRTTIWVYSKLGCVQLRATNFMEICTQMEIYNSWCHEATHRKLVPKGQTSKVAQRLRQLPLSNMHLNFLDYSSNTQFLLHWTHGEVQQKYCSRL